MSFKTLKKNRAKTIEELRKAAEEAGSGGKKSYKDDTFWQPTVDKAGNGYAVIRFLPGSAKDATPWARFWDHAFKGPTGRWYIEWSRTSIGEDDPVSDLNSKLWNSGIESDKDIVRARKRRLHYVSNILVISDPGNPDNEGKVFKFKYGKKIFDKIMDAMQPQFEDETPVNPFDFWEGANFKLKIRMVEGYRNYDKSEFDKVSALFDGDDKKLEELYNNLYELSEFTDPKNYKSYEALEKKMLEVLGDQAGGSFSDHARGILDSTSSKGSDKITKQADEMLAAFTPDKSDDEEDEDTEDYSMGFFARLAQED